MSARRFPLSNHLYVGGVALRVVLVDDIPEVLGLLRALIRRHIDAEIVGEAGTAADAVRLTRELQPDAAVLDLVLPDVSGKDLYTMVQAACPETRVIVFTAYETDTAWYAASGVPVLPKEKFDELVAALIA